MTDEEYSVSMTATYLPPGSQYSKSITAHGFVKVPINTSPMDKIKETVDRWSKEEGKKYIITNITKLT